MLLNSLTFGFMWHYESIKSYFSIAEYKIDNANISCELVKLIAVNAM